MNKIQSTEEQLRRHRENNRRYRIRNLEKVKELARERARKKWANNQEWREEQKKKNNKRRRLKYKNDPKWRKKVNKKNKEFHKKNRMNSSAAKIKNRHPVNCQGLNF